MPSVDEILAQIEANGEVFGARVNLGLQRLMIIEQKLNSAHIARLILVSHLSHLCLHPHHEISWHVEEFVQVAHVVQLMLAYVHKLLQIAPLVEHLDLAILDLFGLVARLQTMQFGRFYNYGKKKKKKLFYVMYSKRIRIITILLTMVKYLN